MNSYADENLKFFINGKAPQYNSIATERDKVQTVPLRRSVARQQARPAVAGSIAKADSIAKDRGNSLAQRAAMPKRSHERRQMVRHATPHRTAVVPYRPTAPKPIIIRKKVKSETPFPVGFLFYALIFTLVFLFLTYNYCQINEVTQDINSMENDLAILKKEETRLQVELDSKNDLRMVEELAVGELGMVKADKLTRQYVSLSGGDKIVARAAQQQPQSFGVLLSTVKDFFSKLSQ